MVGTYPLTPDRIREWNEDFDIIISSPELAKEFRRARNTTGNPKKSFLLLHDHIGFEDKEALLTFFEHRRGRWDSFTWVQPPAPIGNGLTYTVRFDQDTLVVEKPLGYSLNPKFKIEVVLLEVL